jgi:hypothetical protein
MTRLQTPISRRSLFRTAGVLALGGALSQHSILRPVSAQQVSPVGEQLYFNETGQVLFGPFLSAWLVLGGPDRTGFPITGVVQIEDRWVQWFEHARLEVVASGKVTPRDWLAGNGRLTALDHAQAKDVVLTRLGEAYAEALGLPESQERAFRNHAPAGNGALYVPQTAHNIVNGFREFYERPGNAERLGYPISDEFTHDNVAYQYFEYGALAWNPALNLLDRLPLGTLDAEAHGQPVRQAQPAPDGAQVYGPGYFLRTNALEGRRWIEVNLSTYTLNAFINSTSVLTTPVVTGAAVSPTAAGDFEVYLKYEAQDMEGVGADGREYFQADVPWVMYFFQDFALHGAYWRNGFGYAASHGCVNIPVPVAEQLWYWADYGTPVSVHW